MMRVAKLGRVVSPVTSYLAIEPGVRPSTAGIERGGAGSGSGSGGGFGMGGWGSGGGVRVPPDPKALMQPHVKRCVALHKPAANWTVRLRMETTYDEVVDVIGLDKKSALRRCLVEGAWKVRLTGRFNLQRETFQISLP